MYGYSPFAGGGYGNQTGELLSAAKSGGMIALIVSVILTVLLLIFVVPEKRRASLPGFFRGLSDIFNFRGLLIEFIVKTAYIFLTLFVITAGIVAMIEGAKYGVGPVLTGLAAVVIGPLALRLIFEGLMLFILLVRNTIQINNKLSRLMQDLPAARGPAGPGPVGPAGPVPGGFPPPPTAPYAPPAAPCAPEAPVSPVNTGAPVPPVTPSAPAAPEAPASAPAAAEAPAPDPAEPAAVAAPAEPSAVAASADGDGIAEP